MTTGDSMKNKVQHYKKDALNLQSDIEGARMWGVALENTQLTYFEVNPNCTFEQHTHPSEQITLVLNGELFFELDEKTICVKQGEVIAIPSDVPHAVFTKDHPVKAVDAWSPVMDRYK